MKQIQRVYQKRTAKGYVADPSVSPCTDPHDVERYLLSDMIAKHYWKAQYVASIKRHQNYDGTCDYIVTYRDDYKPYGRAVYTVREH